MGVLAWVLTVIRSLAVGLSNPQLGGGSHFRMDEASELLSVLGDLIEGGEETVSELKAFAEEIEAMAAANRGPTPQEWEALRARADSAHARLQRVKAELEAEEEPTQEANGEPVEVPPDEDPTADSGEDETV